LNTGITIDNPGRDLDVAARAPDLVDFAAILVNLSRYLSWLSVLGYQFPADLYRTGVALSRPSQNAMNQQ
jgi:hypothetical protein